MKILLAIPDETTRNELCAQLCKRIPSDTIETVEDGERLRVKILECRPGLVVMDVLLTGLDGVSVLYWLRGLPPERQPAVIVLSGLRSRYTLDEVARLQPDYCTTLPCDIERMTERILTCCRQQIYLSLEGCGGLEKRIEICLRACGFSPKSNGWRYIREGIKRILDDPELGRALTKRLYPEIAKSFHTNCACVERSIRNAISTAWKQEGALWQKELFRGRPTNGELLNTIADYLRTYLDETVN